MRTNIKTLEQQLLESENRSAELRKKIKAEKEKNKPKSIRETINGMEDIMKILDADESKDVINIDKFDSDEINVVKAFIQKMRVTKVYREGKVPKRGEKRYYPYYDVSSGFVFLSALYGATWAGAASASRLCLLSDEDTSDYDKKFRHIEEALIDLK